jgi:hypothetical protein
MAVPMHLLQILGIVWLQQLVPDPSIAAELLPRDSELKDGYLGSIDTEVSGARSVKVIAEDLPGKPETRAEYELDRKGHIVVLRQYGFGGCPRKRGAP